MPRRPCLGCPHGNLAEPGKPRCRTCESVYQRQRNASRPQYRGDYNRRAAAVRATATICSLCGEGPRPGDPWQADHTDALDPNTPLRPAHRSCNARKGATTDRPRRAAQRQATTNQLT